MGHKADWIKGFIKGRFTTVARFADLAGLKYADVLKTLKRVDSAPELDQLLDQAKTTKVAGRYASFEIKPEDLAVLRSFIAKKFDGNVSAFCRETGNDNQTVFQVLDGLRKRRSPLVVQLMLAAKVPGYKSGAKPTK